MHEHLLFSRVVLTHSQLLRGDSPVHRPVACPLHWYVFQLGTHTCWNMLLLCTAYTERAHVSYKYAECYPRGVQEGSHRILHRAEGRHTNIAHAVTVGGIDDTGGICMQFRMRI